LLEAKSTTRWITTLADAEHWVGHRAARWGHLTKGARIWCVAVAGQLRNLARGLALRVVEDAKRHGRWPKKYDVVQGRETRARRLAPSSHLHSS
jgi:hypothetical protein